MGGLLSTLRGRIIAAGVALAVLVAAFLTFTGGGSQRHVTAYFAEAVSVYPGTDVRIMGVKVGQVTAVVPQGNEVRVDMEYDGQYQVPASAQAVVVNPTLVADRFVQLTPANTNGPVMADGASIPLASTGSPVEIDRIYKSLAVLTQALGPNGVNKNGTLNKLLREAASALNGRGPLVNSTIRNMAAAVSTFGQNADPAFASVRQMAAFTNTLAQNDAVVNAFMTQLAGVSGELSSMRGDLGGALSQLAQALATVRVFVHNNRKGLHDNIVGLTKILGALASEKDAIATEIEKGALGASNLAIAFDVGSGSEDSRTQVGPLASNPSTFLCDLLRNARVPNANLGCTIFQRMFGHQSGVNLGAGVQQTPVVGNARQSGSLSGLLGGGR